MANNIHAEGAIRPNESKNHVSATNAEQWERIVGTEGARTFWFKFSADKDAENKYVFETSHDNDAINSVEKLKLCHNAFRAFINGLDASEDAEALKAFKELIKKDPMYDAAMALSKNLTIDFAKSQRKSGKLIGGQPLTIELNDGTFRTYFRYAIEDSKLTYSMATNLWDNAKEAAIYSNKFDYEEQKRNERAEQLRKEREERERERREIEELKESSKKKDAMIAELAKKLGIEINL